MIDTHAHIYSAEFDNDQKDMIFRSKEAEVSCILMPAIDALTHDKMLRTEKDFPGFCYSMMGVHPCSISENYKKELKIAEDFFSKRKFVAVGETGLDFYWDVTYKKEQYDAFNQQIEWALQYDVPVVIHSRNSTDECIETVAAHQQGKLKGVFHCFSGNAEQAKKIIDLGFYLGIGGVVTFKNSGLDKVIKEIGLSHVVLETDAPYLAPVPFRGKRNECSYLKYVAEKLAMVAELDAKEVERITTGNAEKLFSL